MSSPLGKVVTLATVRREITVVAFFILSVPGERDAPRGASSEGQEGKRLAPALPLPNRFQKTVPPIRLWNREPLSWPSHTYVMTLATLRVRFQQFRNRGTEGFLAV